MSKKALSIKTIKAPKQPGLYGDGIAPGLYLRIAPHGSKSWILRIVAYGRRRDIGFGGFPTTSLAAVGDPIS